MSEPDFSNFRATQAYQRMTGFARVEIEAAIRSLGESIKGVRAERAGADEADDVALHTELVLMGRILGLIDAWRFLTGLNWPEHKAAITTVDLAGNDERDPYTLPDEGPTR